MPPLGPLYKQRVFADTTLATEQEIVFNAGTHIVACGEGAMDAVWRAGWRSEFEP